MAIFRLYAGADGKSHIEDQGLSSHPMLTTPLTAAHIVFNQMPVGMFIDWHPAPRRQYVIILSGQLEIGLGDGTVRRFGAGDARLVEDITGTGHATRVVGSEPVVTANASNVMNCTPACTSSAARRSISRSLPPS